MCLGKIGQLIERGLSVHSAMLTSAFQTNSGPYVEDRLALIPNSIESYIFSTYRLNN